MVIQSPPHREAVRPQLPPPPYTGGVVSHQPPPLFLPQFLFGARARAKGAGTQRSPVRAAAAGWSGGADAVAVLI
jgi:hypothetical protein